MNQRCITVREHARLTTAETPDSLDRAQVSVTAFDWLCQLQAGFSKSGARLVEVEDRRWLRLDNFVGVVQTPCGTLIEILPKHYEEGEDLAKSRALLCKLIASALNIPHRQTDAADLQLFRYPLSEWVMRQFLDALNTLLKRGLRFEYQQVEEELSCLRGQLDMSRQMRQPPTRQHLFHLRHALFLPDRAENRLLRLALDKVCQTTQESGNWRLSHEMSGVMQEVPPSRQVKFDFSRWGEDRLMAHYRAIRPWCELVLGEHMPLAVQGEARGISLLFPMERLFEQHVAAMMKRALTPGATLRTQAKNRWLARHKDTDLFLLKPDMAIAHYDRQWVLDTKWKRLNSIKHDGKYDIDQGDFYQMLAYGMRYMDGIGDMVLVYPRSPVFRQPLAPFSFPAGLTLHAWPFDLDLDELIVPVGHGLPLASVPQPA